MLDAELARQGLRPNRVFSDGSALPVSFEDLHRGYVRKVQNRCSILMSSARIIRVPPASVHEFA